MSHEIPSARTIDDRLLDSLVDGELDATARRKLFSVLDENPGGWRHCALAFLEAQAWRADLRGAMNTPGRISASAVGPSVRKLSQTAAAAKTGLIAAAVAIAFAAGRLTGPRDIARPSVAPGAMSSQVVQHGHDEQRPADSAAADAEGRAVRDKPDARVAGVLTLEIDDHGQSRSIRVPVFEGARIDTRWLLDQPPAIRASVVQALERRGHRVEAHRQLVTLSLKDGRKLILPVEEVDVRFGARVFQ